MIFIILDKENVKMDKRNNEKVSKLWGYWNIAEAILLISAGVLAIVFGSLIKADDAASSSSKTIELTLSIVIGLFVAMDGLLRIILVLARVKDSEQPIMLIGGFEISAGIVVMMISSFFVDTIIKFLGVFLTVIGLLFIIYSIAFIVRRRGKILMPSAQIAFGAILAALGAAILIVYLPSSGGDAAKEAAKQMISMICIGSVLSIAGLAQLVITIIYMTKKSKLGDDGDDGAKPIAAAEKTEVIDVKSDDEKKQIETKHKGK